MGRQTVDPNQGSFVFEEDKKDIRMSFDHPWKRERLLLMKRIVRLQQEVTELRQRRNRERWLEEQRVAN